jgi:hypothetical protein
MYFTANLLRDGFSTRRRMSAAENRRPLTNSGVGGRGAAEPVYATLLDEARRVRQDPVTAYLVEDLEARVDEGNGRPDELVVRSRS